MVDRREGTVKWFNARKGFGFLKCLVMREDIFVHSSQVSGKVLVKGQRVNFDLVRSDKGYVAKNVVVVEGGSVSS